MVMKGGGVGGKEKGVTNTMSDSKTTITHNHYHCFQSFSQINFVLPMDSGTSEKLPLSYHQIPDILCGLNLTAVVPSLYYRVQRYGERTSSLGIAQ